jgi:hypothetical protein
MLTRIVRSEWAGTRNANGILNGRITYHVINSGWIGNLLAILNHTSDMKAQNFCRPAPRFFQSSTSHNATQENLGSSRQNPTYDPYADRRYNPSITST